MRERLKEVVVEGIVVLVLAFCTIAALGGLDLCSAQDKSTPAQSAKAQPAVASPEIPPAPAGTAAPPPGSVTLTEDELKDPTIVQLKLVNLALEKQQIDEKVEERFHFNQQQQDLMKQNQDVTAKLAKAHSLDLKKYRLDIEAKAFVPIPAAPAAPPPAPPSSSVPGAVPANAPPVSHVVPAKK